MVQYASLALEAGLVNYVVLVYGDTPLEAGRRGGRSLCRARGLGRDERPQGAYGEFGGNIPYALAARRHMELFGTTSEQLGAIAVAQREWALMNPPGADGPSR